MHRHETFREYLAGKTVCSSKLRIGQALASVSTTVRVAPREAWFGTFDADRFLLVNVATLFRLGS